SCTTWFIFFFSSRRRHTRSKRDWSSDVCSSDLADGHGDDRRGDRVGGAVDDAGEHIAPGRVGAEPVVAAGGLQGGPAEAVGLKEVKSSGASAQARASSSTRADRTTVGPAVTRRRAP